jgi:hypothetical protein
MKQRAYAGHVIENFGSLPRNREFRPVANDCLD